MFKALIENLQKMAGFKLKYGFYKRLFIGVVLGFGADYFFNTENEWRLRIFTFGVSIIVVFSIFRIITMMKYYHSQKLAVDRLSTEDCEYVIKCDLGEEFYSFKNLADYHSFDTKWNYILSIPHGNVIEFFSAYRIYANNRAVRLIKRKKKKNE